MTTTKSSMTVGELVGKILGEGNSDFLRQALMTLVDQIMAVKVEPLIGAAERRPPPRLPDRGLDSLHRRRSATW